MAPLLYQRNAITAFVVTDANQNGFALACDEHILFFVYRDTILYENRDGAIVRLFPTLISKLGKLLKELAFAAGSDS